MDKERAVLVVEDERRSGGWLGRFLCHAGYKCYKAENGSGGIDLLEKEKIQMVVSEVELPDMDFIEFIKAVKSKKPYVEVIFLAKHGSIHQAVKAIKCGAFQYLVRGRNDDALLPALVEANELVFSHG